MTKLLVIQTAFIGDVILATGVVEKLREHFPEAQIDFLLRKGNEGLLDGHPKINHVLVWNKQQGKYSNLLQLSKQIRKTKYDYVINLQRFAASGFLAMRSKATHKFGFDKNPFATTYTLKVKHEIGNGKHEIERNHELIASITDATPGKPVLYPSENDRQLVAQYQHEPYYCIAPTSVWFTKQFPVEQWIEVINKIGESNRTFLLGGPGDYDACDSLKRRCYNKNVVNLAGELSFLQSAALMQGAIMNFVNDSAPQHMASAMNAPVTTVFCSTIPEFGFGPLSDQSTVVQTNEKLDCRPCGLHGLKACPKGHFNCANTIHVDQLLP